ncbi:MAG: hypothetical protein ASARMPRED_005286 [Alectoria sarmentosa]|nr:MAG: hypothetical protein ASARMPRED_005286 [Alectoria sarmentosa]
MTLQIAVPALWGQLTILYIIAIIFYSVSKALHLAYFHPLAKYPGPKFAAISNTAHCYWFLGGRQPYKLLDLHKKYGTVVRTAPNELSFSSSQSWKDIYAFRPGHKTFIKSEFYDGGSFADQAHSIVSERDPTEHGKMRKYLSHAFSDRSLSEQEHLISSVIDSYILKLGKVGHHGLDLSKTFEMIAFDIIGSLAFGETFGGSGSDKPHQWISIAVGALMQGALADTFKRFVVLGEIVKLLIPGKLRKLIQDTHTNETFSIDLVKKRICTETDRMDFMTRILENRNPQEVSDIQIAAHASDFVLAGSETTSTALSCITFYILQDPRIMKKLQAEIRSSFKFYGEINAQSTAPLKYLHAVALEGLRMYPPLPFALPRVVPDGGDTTIVSTNPTAASLSPANFDEPLTFRPERWIGKNTKDILDASQPFSLGPRGCLGRNLAWVELRTILAKLHFTYDLKMLDKDLDWHRDSKMQTLWQRPPLKVGVEKKTI